jgi:hypothetical protein
MNSLIKNIEEVIDKSINEFSILICKKYKNVDINELKNIWKKLHNNENTEEEESKCSTPTSISSKKSDNKDKSEENKCPYVASKGKNQGSKCGAKPKVNSKYCSRHSKYEKEDKTENKKEDDKEDKTENVEEIKEVNEIKEDKPEKKKNKSVIKKKVVKKVSPEVKKVERVLQNNKDINKLWHKETKLVFETKDKDTIAIGTFDSDKIDKMDKNKQIKPLTDSDIDNCKLWNFQYDNTVIKDISKLRLKEIEEVLNELQIPRSESKKSIKSLTKELVSNKKDDESVDEKSVNESVEDDIDIEDDFLEEED